jgi:hypothetical protein
MQPAVQKRPEQRKDNAWKKNFTGMCDTVPTSKNRDKHSKGTCPTGRERICRFVLTCPLFIDLSITLILQYYFDDVSLSSQTQLYSAGFHPIGF